jgi:hypothetical protein
MCALEKGKAIYFSGEAKQLNEFLKEVRSAIMKRGSLEQVMQLDDLLNLNDLYIYAYNKLPKSTIQRAYLNSEKAEVLNDPKVASWANNFLGFILLWQNELEESEIYMKKSLTLAERISSYENVITAISYLILYYRKKQNPKKTFHYLSIGMKLCLQTRSQYLLHFKAAELSLKMNQKPRVDLTTCLQEVLQLRKNVPPNYPLKFIFEGPLLRYYLEIADFSNAYTCLNSLLEVGQKKWDMPIEKRLKILAKSLLEKNELAISSSFKDLLKANKIHKLGIW